MAFSDIPFLSTLLGFDISTTTAAGFILTIVIPFIVVWYAMYLLLCKIRIIRNNTMNIIIGSFMSFLTIRLGMLAMWLGFAGILVLKFNRWQDKLLASIVFIIFVTRISASIFSVSGLLVVVCLTVSLLGVLKIGSMPMKIGVIVIMFIVHWLLSPYALVADAQVRLTI